MNRKCKICKSKATRSTPSYNIAYCDDIDCAMAVLDIVKKKQAAAKEKAIKSSLRKRKAKLDDTVQIWTKKAQREFNRYIRLRDAKEPCISCGNYHAPKARITGSNWDCGHYRSVGSCPELRFNAYNAHGQHSRPCNKDLSGDVVNYRRNLEVKIGSKKLAWIEGPHTPKRYRVDDLKRIHKIFKYLCKRIERNEKI